MEENVKLARIKKSCKVGQTVSTILFVLVIVCFGIAVVFGSVVLGMRDRFEAVAQEAVESGALTTEFKWGGIRIMEADSDWINSLIGTAHSDVPAINEAMQARPFTSSLLSYLLMMAVMCALIAVILGLVRSVFALIRTEDTPFCDKVIKRVLIAMAVTSGILFFTVSAGLGAVCGILTWAVYAIMDYGKTLQLQSDETL